jgi:hypothetical protein
MSDIFISYAREDGRVAQKLAQALEGRGWSVFWDRTIPPGRNWHNTIGKELAEARSVIVLWSEASISSDWVIEESTEAKIRDILFPVLIQDVQPPLGLRLLHAVDLKNWNGSEASLAYTQLIAAISAKISTSTLPAPKRKNKNRTGNINYSLLFGHVASLSFLAYFIFTRDSISHLLYYVIGASINILSYMLGVFLSNRLPQHYPMLFRCSLAVLCIFPFVSMFTLHHFDFHTLDWGEAAAATGLLSVVYTLAFWITFGFLKIFQLF